MITKILTCGAIFLSIVGCSEGVVGYGKLLERKIIDETGRKSAYHATILDTSCNCTRTFNIEFYSNFYKPEIGSEVYVVRNDLYGLMLQEK